MRSITMKSISTKSDKKRKIVKGGSFGYEEKNKVKICREIADIFEQLHFLLYYNHSSLLS